MNKLASLYLLAVVFISLIVNLHSLSAQDSRISLRDLVDLSPISGAEVHCLGSDKQIKARYRSNSAGYLFLKDSLNTYQALHIQHDDYQSIVVKVAQVVEQNYVLYLDSKIINLDEVVFTANKYRESKDDIPFQIEVITQKDISFQNPQTSADLLEQSGKVFVQRSQMGGGSPNIRGFEANKVQIVVDGVRLNNAIYRGGHLQNVITLDPNMIDRTEVLFGPGSVIYGSDALGGVMHFYSRKPTLSQDAQKPYVKTGFFTRYATANHEKTLHADLNIGMKKWGSLTSFSVSDFEDLRTGSNRSDEYPNFGKREFYAARIAGQDSMVSNSDVNLQRFSGYTQYDFMQKFLFLQNESVSHNFNFQFSTSSDVPRYDRLSEIRNGNLRFAEWKYGPQQRIFASYQLGLFNKKAFDQLYVITAYQDIEESRINRRFGNAARRHREERVQVFSVNMDANKLLKEKHELAYGAEFIWNDVASQAFQENIETRDRTALDTRYPDGGSAMRFMAAYFSYRWEISRRWIFSSGLRFTDVFLRSNFEDKSFFPFLQDEIRQSSQAFSGNTGMVYKGGNGWRVSLLLSSGFRAPNVDDVGKAFDSTPGNVIVPNPDVNPEYTYNTELSIKKQIGTRFSTELTAFFTYYDNALVVQDFSFEGQDSIVYDGVLSRVQANVNARRAQIMGFSHSVSYQIAAGFSLSNTLTYTYGQDRSSEVPMSHIAPLFGRASLDFRSKAIHTELFSLYNGRKPIERYNPNGEDNQRYATEDGLPGWITLNLRSSFSVIQGLRLQFGVENILDTHYRRFASGISAPGRNWFFAIKGNF